MYNNYYNNNYKHKYLKQTKKCIINKLKQPNNHLFLVLPDVGNRIINFSRYCCISELLAVLWRASSGKSRQ